MKGIVKDAYFNEYTSFRIPYRFTRRDYEFFGVLAGVRSLEQIPIKAPCGVPVNFQRELNGAEHSFTTITLAELKKYHRNRKYRGYSYLKNKISLLITYLEAWTEKDLVEDKDVAIIVGFDS